MKSLFRLTFAAMAVVVMSCTSTVSVPVENIGKYEDVDFRKGDEIITIIMPYSGECYRLVLDTYENRTVDFLPSFVQYDIRGNEVLDCDRDGVIAQICETSDGRLVLKDKSGRGSLRGYIGTYERWE